MKQYTADLPIVVDLNTIAKYHSVTKLKVDYLTKQGHLAGNYSDTLMVFVIRDDNTKEYHPAYNYWEYAEAIGLNESTANNLLYLIYVNCLYEWKVYSEALIPESNNNIALTPNTDNISELHLELLAREELLMISDLCLMLESQLTKTELKFDYIENFKRSEESKRDRHKVLGVKITDKFLVESVLNYTIDKLFNNAREGNNDVLRTVLKDRSPDYKTIDDILKQLPIPPAKTSDGISSFRKYLIDLIISFMKEEAGIQIDKKRILTPESLVIYSLFSLLGLIKMELIENHVNNESRTNYISKMGHNQGNINKKKQKKEIGVNEEPYSFNDVSFESI